MTLWLLALGAALAGVVPGGLRSDGRPVLSGATQTMDSPEGFFRVHYTTEGADAVTGGDDDLDGVPDKVTRALSALGTARALYLEEGWRPLVGDDGTGGTAGIDLYLQEVDINGYAHGVEVAGEVGRGSCWIEVDNAASDAGLIFESVVTHELHHCIQYRYTWEGASWLFEGTATFEQYRAVRDGALNVGLAALYFQRLTQPELPIDSRVNDYEYAAFLFFKFWRELDGLDEQRLPDLWEALALQPDWYRTLDAESRTLFARSFEDLFLEHATWNAFACGRDDGQHYDPDAVGCEWNTAVPVTEVAVGERFTVSLDARFSAAYFEVPGEVGRSLAVSCGTVPDRGEAGVALVVLEDGVRSGVVQGSAQAGEPLSATFLDEVADRALVVVVSTLPGSLTLECIATRYEVFVVDPGGSDDRGCNTGSAVPGSWLLLGILVVASRGVSVLSAARKPWR